MCHKFVLSQFEMGISKSRHRSALFDSHPMSGTTYLRHSLRFFPPAEHFYISVSHHIVFIVFYCFLVREKSAFTASLSLRRDATREPFGLLFNINQTERLAELGKMCHSILVCSARHRHTIINFSYNFLIYCRAK